jgi:hypothetical protein
MDYMVDGARVMKRRVSEPEGADVFLAHGSVWRQTVQFGVGRLKVLPVFEPRRSAALGDTSFPDFRTFAI